jgi:hypothetical protein
MLNIDITAHAMLVNVHVGAWSGFKRDKGAAREVADSANATDKEAFSVSKRLISKESIDPVNSAMTAIRTHFADRTLPWKDNGDRLLPRKMYQVFIDEHAVLEQAYYDAVNQFIRDYANEREEARGRLGSRFSLDEYPHPDDVRGRFYCRVVIDAITDAKDFRVGMSKDAIDVIRGQIETDTMQRIMDAQKDVWARIEETVTHFAGRIAAQLEEPVKGKRRSPLHQSTVNNLIHLVNALPALNIVGDPNMKAVGRRLHGLLSNYSDVEPLKGNPSMCAAAHDELQDIIAEMSAFSKAFEAN